MRAVRNQLNVSTKIPGGSTLGSILVYLTLSLVALSMLFPYIHELAKSFSHPLDVTKGNVSIWPVNFTFGNYYYYYRKHMMTLLRSFGATVFITVIGTFLSLLCTSLAAFSLARGKKEFKLATLLMALAMFSIIFPPPIIPYFLTIKSYGLMDSLWAIIIPHLVIAYHLIILRTFFRTIPEELYDSCRLDGASEARMFWHITLPLSKAALATISIFTAVILWNIFMHALLFIRDVHKIPLQIFIRSVFEGGFGSETNPLLAIDIYTQSDGIKSSLIIITTAPIVALYLVFQRHFIKGMMLGSIKE
ncbi:MAG TPA: carbohydrate ABC transporter permease [bacterium]|nr:carbohydrate ABC transporter permease [bacterium]